MTTFDPRQGDLGLFQTLDGGDLRVVNGEPVMDQGLEAAVYLSLEGAGATDWWANEYYPQAQQIVSRFAKFRQSRSLTSGVITISEDLIKQDLTWLVSEKVASKVDVSMVAVSRNRVEITVVVEIDGKAFKLSPFQLNWQAQESYPLNQRI